VPSRSPPFVTCGQSTPRRVSSQPILPRLAVARVDRDICHLSRRPKRPCCAGSGNRDYSRSGCKSLGPGGDPNAGASSLRGRLDAKGNESGWTNSYVIHGWPPIQGQSADFPGDTLASAYDIEPAVAAALKPQKEMGEAYDRYLRMQVVASVRPYSPFHSPTAFFESVGFRNSGLVDQWAVTGSNPRPPACKVSAGVDSRARTPTSESFWANVEGADSPASPRATHQLLTN